MRAIRRGAAEIGRYLDNLADQNQLIAQSPWFGQYVLGIFPEDLEDLDVPS